MSSTYTMIQCLGRGGFGEVYLASQVSRGLTKRVAVKVLRADLEDDDGNALARFKDEADLLAALDHPAILGVHELTRLAGRVALVTEFVDGIDLARFVKPGHLLPSTVAVSAMAEVAAALDCAWNTRSPTNGEPLHLVHRDVKPDNIRIGKHGEVKLLDFGIAHSQREDRRAKTRNGDIPFTPGYAAPEAFTQITPGQHTDVFALGATLYRLLTGERLYEGLKLSDQIVLSNLPDEYRARLTAQLAKVDHPPLRELLARCMAYEADRRPTAAEVQVALERIADDMVGPTVQRWARSVEMPPPKAIEGSLTGRVLREEAGTMVVKRPPPWKQPDMPTLLLPDPVGEPPRPVPAKRGRRMWGAIALLVVALLVAVPLAGFVVMTLAGTAYYWAG